MDYPPRPMPMQWPQRAHRWSMCTQTVGGRTVSATQLEDLLGIPGRGIGSVAGAVSAQA